MAPQAEFLESERNMTSRPIFNYEGIQIGVLQLPVETSEEVWAARLAIYAKPPPSQQEQLAEMLSRKVSKSREIADDIIERFKKTNLQFFLENNVSNDLAILMSTHVHHRLRAVDVTINGNQFTIDLMNLVISGDLETAYMVLGYMQPDSMAEPFHFLSQEKIDDLRAMIFEGIRE